MNLFADGRDLRIKTVGAVIRDPQEAKGGVKMVCLSVDIKGGLKIKLVEIRGEKGGFALGDVKGQEPRA